MKLDIPKTKSVVYPVRLSPETFEKIKKLAKQNKTDNGKVIRALIEKSLV